jgi:hypothetical protein
MTIFRWIRRNFIWWGQGWWNQCLLEVIEYGVLYREPCIKNMPRFYRVYTTWGHEAVPEYKYEVVPRPYLVLNNCSFIAVSLLHFKSKLPYMLALEKVLLDSSPLLVLVWSPLQRISDSFVRRPRISAPRTFVRLFTIWSSRNLVHNNCFIIMTYNLHYWAIKGRAEPIRLLLEYLQVRTPLCLVRVPGWNLVRNRK